MPGRRRARRVLRARRARLPQSTTWATTADRRSRLLAEVDRFANVRTAGRQGLFRYVFMDAAMRMGIRAAEQMLEGRRDGAALDAIGRAGGVVEATALTALVRRRKPTARRATAT